MVEYYIKKPDLQGKFINPELVTTYAQKCANSFCNPNDPKSRYNVSAAQLRRFYGDVKSLEMRYKNAPIEDKDKVFLEILPLIKLLKAKAAYALKRELVNNAFKDWIWENVGRIDDEKDFQAFLLCFEAVVGFCYGNGLKD